MSDSETSIPNPAEAPPGIASEMFIILSSAARFVYDRDLLRLASTCRSLWHRLHSPVELNAVQLAERGDLPRLLRLRPLNSFDLNEVYAVALERGYHCIIDFALEDGAQPTIHALRAACRGGDLSLVKQLYREEWKGLEGGILEAVRMRRENVVRYLIEKNPRCADRAMMTAYFHGFNDIGKMIQDFAHCSIVNALNGCCLGRREEEVKRLIEMGVEPDWETIVQACSSGSERIVALVEDYALRWTINADLRTSKEFYADALSGAILGRSLPVVEKMLEKYSSVPPLTAADAEDAEDAEGKYRIWLLEAGARGLLPIVKVLLERLGHRKDIVEEVFIEVCVEDQLEIAEYFVATYKSVSDGGLIGKRNFSDAALAVCMRGAARTFKYLLSLGHLWIADPGRESLNGKSYPSSVLSGSVTFDNLLHAAIQRDRVEIVKMILSAEAGRIGCIPGECTMILSAEAGRIGCIPGECTMITPLPLPMPISLS